MNVNIGGIEGNAWVKQLYKIQISFECFKPIRSKSFVWIADYTLTRVIMKCILLLIT